MRSPTLEELRSTLSICSWTELLIQVFASGTRSADSGSVSSTGHGSTGDFKDAECVASSREKYYQRSALDSRREGESQPGSAVCPPLTGNTPFYLQALLVVETGSVARSHSNI